MIPLALGMYLGLTWNTSPFELNQRGSFPSKYEILTPALVREIEEMRKRWNVAGVSIAVVMQDNGWEYDQWKTDTLGLGVADGSGTQVDDKTLFSIASNTKLFVALSTGIIIENETTLHGDDARLAWSTKVKHVIPDWQLMDPVASEYADVVDLLGHRTGVGRHDFAFEMAAPISDMISKMRYLRPSEEFRKTFQYNNAAYLIATTFPENLYDIPFGQYLQSNMLDKLNMTNTYLDIAEAPPKEKRSQGFSRRNQRIDACREDEGRLEFSKECFGNRMNIGYFDYKLDRLHGHWGVISNAQDMAPWLKMLLLGGRSPQTNETVVPLAAIEKTSTAYTVAHQNHEWDFPESGKITYGMAQQMSMYRGHRLIEHTGTIPGQSSRVVRIPGSNIGIAVMANDYEFGFHFVMAASYRIIDHMLGMEPINWERRVPPVRASDATLPDMPIADIQGTYVDKAYGRLTICLVPSGHPTGNPKIPSECAKTLADQPFDLSSKVLGDGLAPMFIARCGQVSTAYLLFRHQNASTFTVSVGMHFPETKTDIPSIYWYWDAIFEKDGMAFAGNAWGAGLGVEPREPWGAGGLKRNAEVWFDKVGE
ncbi:hypothetical protein QFC22_003753 [Naganishia vaughanmartiniae]|uniref:Uncharacterized protein n=1 Tax=Naganishia vaughanmartiniae TaxID=1424756 RepID=A0ACC2X568_9TREE|nr:hypothetical protein QFC22_003753 [Naganishia vaughanmartiniae]